MDHAHITWLILIAIGVVLGLFVKAKHVAIFGAAAFALTVIAFVASLIKNSQIGLVLGWGLIVVPLIFGLVAVGALIGNALRERNKAGKSQGS